MTEEIYRDYALHSTYYVYINILMKILCKRSDIAATMC